MRDVLTIILLLGVSFFVLTFFDRNSFFHKPPSPSFVYALTTLESEIQKVAEDYQAAVVTIVATNEIPIIEQCNHEQMPLFEEAIFNENNTIVKRCKVEDQILEVAGGTGFVVDKRGILLTTKQVVADPQGEYTVLFNDGKKAAISAIQQDTSSDIVLIKIEKTLDHEVVLGDSDDIRTGNFVIAVGNSLGEFRNSANFGVVSNLNRTITTEKVSEEDQEKLEKVIQTDAMIHPGNSGGPLINLKGEVVGINTARKQIPEAIGFAVPINTIKPILQKFIN